MIQNMEEALEKTRETVAQITAWCIVIALHQKFGVGGVRIERVAEEMVMQQGKDTILAATRSRAALMAELETETAAYLGEAFRVPLNRAVKNRDEELLRTAADQSAQIAWVTMARAAHQVLGFGRQRLEELRLEAMGNYRTFNEWSLQKDDKEWAMERLRRCAEAAVGEPLAVVAEDSGPDLEDRYQARRMKFIKDELNRRKSAAARPAGWAVLSPEKQAAAAREIARELEGCRGLRGGAKLEAD